jgi:hypothetical protein
MTGFPNLACRDQGEAMVNAVTSTCRAELEAAGIPTHTFGTLLGKSEVPSKCIGTLSGWSFKRAWYYWVAEGPGLPPEAAERLHGTHGRQVRVEGHCGYPSPLEWAHGFAIGSYHVDTPDGLKALADALASIWDDRPQPDAAPMTAVDHAELKRFGPEVRGVQSRYVLVHQLRASADIQDTQTKRETGCATTSDRASLMREAANALEVLLSEIEGLKAEVDGWKEAYDRATRLHAATCRDLRTQAPDSWRPEVSDDDLAVLSQIIHSEYYYGADSMGEALRRIYLALRPQTAESGK